MMPVLTAILEASRIPPTAQLVFACSAKLGTMSTVKADVIPAPTSAILVLLSLEVALTAQI
jgi:hypothetical protein